MRLNLLHWNPTHSSWTPRALDDGGLGQSDIEVIVANLSRIGRCQSKKCRLVGRNYLEPTTPSMGSTLKKTAHQRWDVGLSGDWGTFLIYFFAVFGPKTRY